MANGVVKMLPAEYAVVVTPSDSTNLGYTTRGLYVGGAGNVSVEMAGAGGQEPTVLFTGVQAGSVLPIAVTRVNSTSTTATTIVALW